MERAVLSPLADRPEADSHHEHTPTTGPEAEASCPIDALRSPERLLNRASLEWLMDGGYFCPAPGSPFESLSNAPRWTTGSERQLAGARLLAGDPWTNRAVLAQRLRFSPLGQALAVLERPQARLRIAAAEPGRLPAVVQYFLKGRLAVAAELHPEGLRVAEPLRLAELQRAVHARLDSSALPATMDAMALMPEVFELLHALWAKDGRPVEEPITVAELTALLDSRGRAAKARELLAAMEVVDLLECRDERYFLAPRLAGWLSRVWSGHVLEMEWQSICPAPDEDPYRAQENEQRLLFTGAPGERILCEDLATGPRQSVLLLSRPSSWELGDRLRRLFTGVSQTMRSLLGDGELGHRLSWNAALPVH